ncbi:MAG TPA: transporter [Desulfurella acetivorans]|uniref:Transporter n=1 Tax=Desulfurella acetivorans TaxID=33002 RepID=A0A7C6A7B0_DESAE|nr:transporter [Desulfurella acetivorans]
MIVNELSGILRNMMHKNGVYFFEVNVDGDGFFALQLHNSCKVNSSVKLRFSEGDISIAKKIHPEISISNIHKATIKNIENDNLLCRVELYYKEKSLFSLITFKSLKKLDLKINDKVYFLIEALSVEVFCE